MLVKTESGASCEIKGDDQILVSKTADEIIITSKDGKTLAIGDDLFLGSYNHAVVGDTEGLIGNSKIARSMPYIPTSYPGFAIANAVVNDKKASIPNSTESYELVSKTMQSVGITCKDVKGTPAVPVITRSEAEKLIGR